jgi:DNA-directed RNA polymerase specialized sigma24 family protein
MRPSPLAPIVNRSALRRYRAERLLREEFVGLREEVLRSVRSRLRARGVRLDDGDLEACYAIAWHGLYAAISAGEEIAKPAGWLTVVTFRRAIDEHRGALARGLGGVARLGPAGFDAAHAPHVTTGVASGAQGPAAEPDIAAQLDDRARLRQLFEALRGRLSSRECEAASLCYLQGHTRAEAARRMGISEARMTKLMEGRGSSPGVAGKVGELLEAIRAGQWCEQQSSLMRGFAFGILDPRGERYRLARLHQRECPACRAYVLSLRGLAAVLPPLPLPWVVGLASPHHPTCSTRTLRRSRSPARTSALRAESRHAGAKAGAGARAGVGGGAAAASGAAGAAGAGGAAGGGWLLGSSVGAKLAVGCLLALSVGCVAITATHHNVDGAGRGHRHRKAPAASAYIAGAPSALVGSASPAASTRLGGSLTDAVARRSARTARHISAAAARAAAIGRAADRHAQREFGLEQPAAATDAASASPHATALVAATATATARAASVAPTEATESTTSAAQSPSGSAGTPSSTPSGPPSHAEREFGLE